MGKIITTRDINVDLSRPPRKLKPVTTKDVEVKYIDKDAPPVAPEGPMITTKNIEDAQKKAKEKEAKALKAKKQREKRAKASAEKAGKKRAEKE